MTSKEKAERYDALQMAFKLTKEAYESRRDEACHRWADSPNKSTIAVYNKGQMDAYNEFIDVLERWIGSEDQPMITNENAINMLGGMGAAIGYANELHVEEENILKNNIDAINLGIQAIGFRTPKRPIKVDNGMAECPTCHHRTDKYKSRAYCYECGQALDWRNI